MTEEPTHTTETPPETSPETSASSSRKVPKKSRRRRILKTGLFLLYVLILAEIASRGYWMIKNRDRQMPFFAGWSDWVDRFYEEVRDSGVREPKTTGHVPTFEVLLLGGSALDRVYDSLADAKQNNTALQTALRTIVGQEVRVYNLAHPGMTTRDSLLKYRMLADEGLHFDLVVVYHGINDTRMNNTTEEKFRDDYTHSGFYKQFKRLRDHRPLLPYFTLPYTLEYTAIHILSSKKIGVYLPKHRPSKAQLAHSAEIKTDRTFRQNVEGILDLAEQRREPVLLMTFAWYLPEGYTREKCKAKQLDYADSPRPSLVEMWGSTDGVPKGLRAHNDEIRQLAAEHTEAMFVDADMVIPKKGENFNDVCHLSEAGKVKLMNAFLPKIEAHFQLPGATTSK